MNAGSSPRRRGRCAWMIAGGNMALLFTLLFTLLMALFVTILAASPTRADDTTFVSLGTGARDGLYYPIGRTICRIANREAGGSGLRCSAEATAGSIYNLTGLEAGELEFALVQSDIQADSHAGRGAWARRPATWLRSVFSLHPELVTVIVQASSDIDGFEGLKRKRVNIGAAGSGAQATWAALADVAGWPEMDRPKPSALKAETALRALCDGRVDATVLMLGHPSPIVRKHLEACPARIVDMAGPDVQKLTSSLPYYRIGTIPAGEYDTPRGVRSFGVSATLVTSAKQDENSVYTLAKAIMADIDELRRANPVLAHIEPADMVRSALTAPLHPGAARAYRELGLLP